MFKTCETTTKAVICTQWGYKKEKEKEKERRN
jgi:hypothetical protein